MAAAAATAEETGEDHWSTGPVNPASGGRPGFLLENSPYNVTNKHLIWIVISNRDPIILH